MKNILSILFLFAALLLCGVPARAQYSSDTPKYGIVLPATCTPDVRSQALFYKFGTGRGLYYCSATNTWTLVASAGGSGLTSLNGLINTTQTFGTGTTGTDFNISSSGSLHTFNFPNASASNRGLLTSADWTTFNNKQAGNSNLTAIAGLSPVNDDVLQRKAGAWTNRTPAQFKADLALTKTDVGLGSVQNVDQTNAANVTSGNFGTARVVTGTVTNSRCLRVDGTGNIVTHSADCGAGGGGGGTWGSITGTLSDQTDLQNALNLKANLASPTFTGTPAAPTAAPNTNTTQVATTAFVVAQPAAKQRVLSTISGVSCAQGEIALVSTGPTVEAREFKCVATDSWAENYLAPSSGCTGNQVTGFNAAASAPECKSFVAGTGVNVTNGTGTVTVAATFTPSSSDSLTNKTVDVEGTGNTITAPFRTFLAAAGCNNATAGPFWDLPASTPAVAACVTGTNIQKGVLQFADTSGGFSAQNTMLLPADFTGNIDARILWTTSATTGDVKWSLSTACTAVGASATDDPTFNTASTVTTAAPGTANRVQTSSISAVTATGCAAGNLLHLRIFRDGADSNDTASASVNLIGVEITTRRSM